MCESLHRAEYEDLYLNQKKNVKWIWRYAKSKYNEDVSYSAMVRHFKQHVQYYVDLRKEIDKQRAEIIRKYMYEDILIAQKIHEHLDLIEKQIKEKVNMPNRSPMDEKLMLEWINSARLSIEQLLKWKEKLILPEEDTEEIGKVIEDIIKDFPEEYQLKFIERWREYVSKRQH